jgi:hypothetical protein
VKGIHFGQIPKERSNGKCKRARHIRVVLQVCLWKSTEAIEPGWKLQHEAQTATGGYKYAHQPLFSSLINLSSLHPSFFDFAQYYTVPTLYCIMSSSDDLFIPPSGPSDKALGKRPAVDPPTSDIDPQETESAQQEQQMSEPHEEGEGDVAPPGDDNAPEQEGEQEGDASAAPANAPPLGLLTTTRFQVPAHPEYLSPFEKVMLNNQQLLVECVSGINAKLDYLMTNMSE